MKNNNVTDVTVKARIIACGKTYLLLEPHPIKDTTRVMVTSIDQLTGGTWKPYMIDLTHTEYVTEFSVQLNAICVEGMGAIARH